MLLEPVVDQRHVQGAAHVARALVEGPRGPEQPDARAGVVRVEREVRQHGLHLPGQHKGVLVLLGVLELRGLLGLARVGLVEGDGVDEGVVVVGREVRVLDLDVHDLRVVVGGQLDLPGPVVVQIRESHLQHASDPVTCCAAETEERQRVQLPRRHAFRRPSGKGRGRSHKRVLALYSVRMAERMMSLLMSLNSFQSSSRVSMSRKRGSNLGPPGMQQLRLLAVMNAWLSKR